MFKSFYKSDSTVVAVNLLRLFRLFPSILSGELGRALWIPNHSSLVFSVAAVAPDLGSFNHWPAFLCWEARP